ncbi:hypothetical protein JW906_09735 [bacterium]|nr:hypothetical protein [bacterium]
MSSSTIAVFDMGTQSFLYLFARFQPDGNLEVLGRKRESVRLGRNLEASGRMEEEAVDRAIAVLSAWKEESLGKGAGKIMAVGTHVFRAAGNRAEVLQRIREKTGIAVEILPEREEAMWTYRGAVSFLKTDGETWLIDVGGGSTEIAIGTGPLFGQAFSLAAGSVTLTERFIRHDPPWTHEIEDLTQHAEGLLKRGVTASRRPDSRLIGTAGTLTTAAALLLKLEPYQPEKVEGFIITLGQIKALIKRLIPLPHDRRLRQKGLDPSRADILLAGLLMAERMMSLTGFPEITVSDRGLRFGIAIREWEKGQSS